MICAYCGKRIDDGILNYKGLEYHALWGVTADGRLIRVSRDENCFEQSDFATKSLCGHIAPAIMQVGTA